MITGREGQMCLPIAHNQGVSFGREIICMKVQLTTDPFILTTPLFIYCRSPAIAVLVFDLTQNATFAVAADWRKFVRETADPMFLLVGNNLDLRDARAVDHDRAVEPAKRLECEYVEMSAYTRQGIEEFIGALIDCARNSLATICLHVRRPAAAAADPQRPGCAC
jgi:hypothetical protein